MSNLIHLKKLTKELNAKDKQLKESEELLRLALAAADAGAWTWNIEKNIVRGTPKFHEMFGKHVETYEDFISCLHPEDIERTKQAVEDSIQNGHDYDTHYRIKINDTWKYVHATGRTAKDGAVLTGICIIDKVMCDDCLGID